LYRKILGCHETALTREELNGAAGSTAASASLRRITGTTAVAARRSARTLLFTATGIGDGSEIVESWCY
jgi:hypothetical protein